MRKTVYLSALVLLAFSGCKSKDSFTINGTIKGEKENYIQINKLDVDIPVFLDSVKVAKNGNFRFRIEAENPDFYQVGFSSSNFVTLLAKPGEKIDLTFNGKKLYDNFEVEGSEGTSQLKLLDKNLEITKKRLDSLVLIYNREMSQPDFETSRGPELRELYNNALKEQRKRSIGFIIENPASFASIKALYQKINDEDYVLNQTRDLQYMKIVSDTLSKYYPNSKHVKALTSDLNNGIGKMNAEMLKAMFNDLPEAELNPDLNDINGKRVSLSSLQGKYVLLTFWSVASNSCIEENNQLKDLYRKYKNKGFEIYQINIDPNEAAWKSAVRFDELPWISVREDDTMKLPIARLFNVTALPTNYLFDREGKIIGSNLHGKALQIKLGQLFN
ncbi:MAG TPA: TlpA disulfide reductase family protein [Bacteroidales bacterium]|nr:TlpA disulfide reductase family protein [Bacteroidales bacterium]